MSQYLQQAINLISGLPSGTTFILSSLFGPSWTTIKNPTAFGKTFKKAVKQGQVPGIILLPQKTERNHTEYQKI